MQRRDKEEEEKGQTLCKETERDMQILKEQQQRNGSKSSRQKEGGKERVEVR